VLYIDDEDCRILKTVVEGSFAEVEQVIAGMMLGRFLTSDMASSNDAGHGIDQSVVG